MVHSWCSNLPLSLLCLLSAVVCYDDRSYDDLSLLPLNPEVEDGHWLTLNCTILPQYTGQFTNRDLYFRHGNVNFTNFTAVGSRTALLRLQWTLADDNIGGGHVKCALPDRQYVLRAIQHVTVVRRPLQPNVTGCSLWNWKYVNCTWQPSVSQQQEHMHTLSPLTQTLQWKLQQNAWQDAACQGEVTNSCVWNVSHVINRFMKSESCCVRTVAGINLTYLHFEVPSVQFCFRPVHIVIIDKPRNITAENTDGHLMLVRWQEPLLDRNHISNVDIAYAVTVMSQWDDTPVVNQSVANRSLSISSVPNTRYAVTVKVKTFESHYWSEPAILNFTTAPAKPKMSPRSLKNAYTVSHMERHTRTVVVYWQTLSERDYYGLWLSYVVLMRKDSESHWNELHVVRSADQPWAEVIVDRNADVELAVIARNEVGDTVPDVIMHLPAAESSLKTFAPFVELAVELTNDSEVIWSWELTSSEHASGMTLFWCRSHFPIGRCIGDIQWQEIAAPKSKSEYKLSIEDADDTSQYHYGAALNAHNVGVENGGIKWVTCLYNVNGLAAPVQNVRASVPSFGDLGQLLVTWDPPPCESGYQRGYVKSLVLYYCRRAGTECADVPTVVPLPGYLTAYNLTGLESGEDYSIWLYSISRAGQSLTHSNVSVAKTSVKLMTPAIIAGVTVSLVVVVVATVVIFWVLCRKYCRRFRDKLWSPVTISVPPPQSNTCSAASSPMPIVEYARISYSRQPSRLSSSSRDSGQFGIPLMSPDSCSEFSEVPVATARDNHDEPHQPPSVGVVRPGATTYVNDEVVVLRHPAENNRHLLSSSATRPAECIPLQPIRTYHRPNVGSYAAVVAADEGEDGTRVTDQLVQNRLNGGHNVAALPQNNSDYIPHAWLKM